MRMRKTLSTMKMTLRYISAALGFIMLIASGLHAQGSKKDNVFGGIAQLDHTVHDFGDIMLSDGPVTAEFTVKNVSSDPMVIYNVVTSCGCTNVEWTRQPVKPGESGKIKATYKNDEGAYPFDKTLTAYFSGVKQPVILRLRGESHDRKMSLKQMYPAKFGSLGMKSVDIKGGNMSQGQQKSGEVNIANLGTKPMKVEFSGVSEGLAVSVSPNPVPAGATAKLRYTVTSDRNHWGRNYYYAVPVVDGKTCKAVVTETPERKEAGAEAVVADPNPLLGNGSDKIGIFTVTKEDFSSWSKEERDRGSQPIADESTYSFGKVKAGTKVTATFSIRNQGKSPFHIYKVDSESSHAKALPFPDLAVGAKKDLKVTLDTAGLPKGETLVVLTVITNSPLRPIINLFIAGWVE